MCAACSCSSPISRSVGTTSRATNGSETKSVASTIAGSANSIWMSVAVEPVAEPAVAAVEQEERQADDDRRERERQVDERVDEALAREPPPHDRERADDAEDVFSGTAIAVMISVSLNACTVFGSRERRPRACRSPFSNVAPEDHRRAGRAARSAGSRARRSGGRTYARSCLVAPAPEAADASSSANEISSSTTATAAAPAAVAALDAVEDEHRGDLGLVREVARDDHDRADLADRARERERRRRRGSRGGCSAARSGGRRVNSPAPSERAASSISRSSSSSTGCTVRTTNGSVTKSSARKIAVRVNATLMPTGDCGP